MTNQGGSHKSSDYKKPRLASDVIKCATARSFRFSTKKAVHGRTAHETITLRTPEKIQANALLCPVVLVTKGTSIALLHKPLSAAGWLKGNHVLYG